jgi:hypothetical protein
MNIRDSLTDAWRGSSLSLFCFYEVLNKCSRLIPSHQEKNPLSISSVGEKSNMLILQTADAAIMPILT